MDLYVALFHVIFRIILVSLVGTTCTITIASMSFFEMQQPWEYCHKHLVITKRFPTAFWIWVVSLTAHPENIHRTPYLVYMHNL